MLSQLSRATRSRSAVAAVSRVARGNAVQVRGFIAPTISRRAPTSPKPPTTGSQANTFPSSLHATPLIPDHQRRGNANLLFFFPVADFVQEIYLKELKAYKTPEVKASDAEGNVQIFNEPKTPVSPEETNLASNLQEYETMAVEIEGQDVAAQSAAGAAEVPDWLEAEEDEEAAH
ncbi:hypothetical protein AK830_g12615 [Neonectria ditissima]|uniref:ATP synthase subunit H, mitochondrial n=1 Tax=Neonectria ditissima TaxID=78410 RepID=A0A0N8H4P6_9HYPO|nr:hypothetical protein AK830_g12615 [Neonectria ditissima]